MKARGVKFGRPTALMAHHRQEPYSGLQMAKRRQTWLGWQRELGRWTRILVLAGQRRIEPGALPCNKRVSMKVALAILALVLTASAAAADPNFGIVPPKEFDRPYEGELVITVARDQTHLSELCSGTRLPPGSRALACAERTASTCKIFLPPRASTDLDWPLALIVRHEIAHCNGWAWDHPGAGPFKTWASV